MADFHDKWLGFTNRLVLDLGTTLATDTLSSFDGTNELDNGTNLDKWGWFQLGTSTGNLVGSAVSNANEFVALYMAKALDGTNYEDTPADGDEDEYPHLLIATFPIPTETVNEPIAVGPILLPPCKVKFACYNHNTGQTMQNTWEVRCFTTNSNLDEQ